MDELLKSKRFWLSVGAVIAILANSLLGVSEEDVNKIVGIVVAWVVSDSIRPTVTRGNGIEGLRNS